MLNSQKSAISAALPPEVSKVLGASGLLAGLGGAARLQPKPQRRRFERCNRREFDRQFRSEERRSRRKERPDRRVKGPLPAAPTSSGFPMWAIILIVIVVLLAIWWFMTQHEKPAEPAKTGQLAPIEYALHAAPSPSIRSTTENSVRAMGLGSARAYGVGYARR